MYLIDHGEQDRADASVWIERTEVPEISRRLQANGQVLVLAPRRSGLTSTLVLASRHQRTEKIICYISGRDVATSTEAEGFRELSSRLGELLPEGLKPTLCEDAHSFRRMLMHTLAVLSKPLLLIVDDLELFPADWRPTWLNVLRSIKHEQHFQPLWQKLRCLVGSHRPDLLYQLDPASPLNFMDTVSLQPTGWQQVRSWLKAMSEPTVVYPTAPLALYGWTQGNPVDCFEVAKWLPLNQPIGADTVATTARKYAERLQLPVLTDDERSFLTVLAEKGTLADSGSDLEEVLISRGILAETKGRLRWASPLVALAWKHQQKFPQHSEPGLVMDESRMEARYQGRLLPLFPQELKVLFYLAQRPGKFLTAEAICRETADDPIMSELGAANVKAQVARLRRKLPNSTYVQTRRNVGYCFNPHLPYSLKS